MRTQYVPLAAALLAGASQASPAPVRDLAPRGAPAAFHVEKSWDNEILYQGLAGFASTTSAALELGVGLTQAAVAADLGISVGDKFLAEPTVAVSIGGLEAYFEVNLAASAAVSEAVELVASEKLHIAVPGLVDVDIGAALALDLVIAASAAVDVHAGFYVKFPAGAFVQISLLTKEIVKVEIGNLIAKPLPIAVAAGVDLAAAVELQFGLRLRAEVGVSTDIKVLGLDIGAGALVSVWVSLFDYTAVIISTGPCPLSIKEKFLVAIGIAVEVNVDVDDLLELSLAPSILITIASAAEVTVCLPGRGVFPPVGSGSGTGGDISGISSSTNSSSVSSHSHSTYYTSSTVPSPYTSSAVPSPYTTSAGYYTSAVGSGQYVTSTIVSTATYTVTSCHASVPYCPAAYTQVIVTTAVVSRTTVCPAGGYPTGRHAVPDAAGATTTVTLTRCPAETRTLRPPPGRPTPRPTMTVTDAYTACGRCSHDATGYSASPVPYPTATGYPYPTASPYPEAEQPEYAEGEQPGYPEGQQPGYPEETQPGYPQEEHPYPQGWTPTYPASEPAKPTYPPGTGAPAYPTRPSYPVVTAGAGRVGAQLAAAVGVVAALL